MFFPSTKPREPSLRISSPTVSATWSLRLPSALRPSSSALAKKMWKSHGFCSMVNGDSESIWIPQRPDGVEGKIMEHPKKKKKNMDD